jgi:hypothetical protein
MKDPGRWDDQNFSRSWSGKDLAETGAGAEDGALVDGGGDAGHGYRAGQADDRGQGDLPAGAAPTATSTGMATGCRLTSTSLSPGSAASRWPERTPARAAAPNLRCPEVLA